MKPARMAVVTTAHPWGDPRVFERGVEACLAWGLEVHLFAVPPASGVPARSHPEGGRLVVHPLPARPDRWRRFLGALGAAWRVLRAGPLPVVHFHDPELLPAMALVALARPGTFILYDIHEDLPLQIASKAYLPPWARNAIAILAAWALDLASRLFHGFAPATEAIARAWPEGATRVVHNYPKAHFLQIRAGRPDPLRLLYTGGLSRGRGLLVILEALREARRRRPGLHLDLAGWILEAEVGEAVAAAVAEGWCRLEPRMPTEALAVYSAGAGIGLATLLPQPNYLEALPTKIFEYMALGIPVLASDVPLWRALVEDSGAGRVVLPRPPELAEAILAMADDPHGLAAMGRRGREACRTRYRWDVERGHLRWHLARAGILPPAASLETCP
jgi:glycosyltransferase involved in cell wall biosynthesis